MAAGLFARVRRRASSRRPSWELPPPLPWRRSAVRMVVAASVVAALTAALGPGVLWALGFLTVIAGVHETGHLLAARATGIGTVEMSIGFGPRLWARDIGSRRYSFRAIPFGAYVNVVGMSPSEKMPPHLQGYEFHSKGLPSRTLVLLGGVLAQVVLGLVVVAVALMTSGLPDMHSGSAGYDTVITEVPERLRMPEGTVPGPAHEAGLRSGDKVVSAAGRPVSSWQGLSNEIVRSAGSPLSLEWETPDGQMRSAVASPVLVQLTDSPELTPFLGVAKRREPLKESSVLRASTESVRLNYQMALSTAGAVHKGITTPVPLFRMGTSPEPAPRETGTRAIGYRPPPPPTLFLAGDAVAHRDWATRLYVLAMFNSLLAVFNLVPLPMLDGGRLVWEAADTAHRRLRAGQPLPKILWKAYTVLALALAVLLLAALIVASVNSALSAV